MSNNSSEPREWWIHKGPVGLLSLLNPNTFIATSFLPTYLWDICKKDLTKVVEYSALESANEKIEELKQRVKNFTALQAENEQLKTQFHQLTVSHDALLVEAKESRSVIDFYADEDRWYVNGNPRLRNHIVDSDLSDVESMCGFGVTVFSCGGKRAREYQAKYNK